MRLTQALVFERYRDSDAGLQHSRNIASLSKELTKVCDMSGQVWGNPSAELRQMLEEAKVEIFTPLAIA